MLVQAIHNAKATGDGLIHLIEHMLGQQTTARRHTKQQCFRRIGQRLSHTAHNRHIRTKIQEFTRPMTSMVAIDNAGHRIFRVTQNRMAHLAICLIDLRIKVHHQGLVLVQHVMVAP